MAEVDLAVIGAGLSGCSLIGRLQQLGSDLKIGLVEAGRGPGGRAATRRRRDQNGWLLNHGAPGFSLGCSLPEGMEALLAPLRSTGVLQKDQRPVLLDAEAGLSPANGPETTPEGGWWHGVPCMASICRRCSTTRARNLSRQFKPACAGWSAAWIIGCWRTRIGAGPQGQAPCAEWNPAGHPRSLAMLAWHDIPLRSAIAEGVDVGLDAALNCCTVSRCAGT